MAWRTGVLKGLTERTSNPLAVQTGVELPGGRARAHIRRLGVGAYRPEGSFSQAIRTAVWDPATGCGC